MKKRILILITFLALPALTVRAAHKLNIVATIPDLADMTRRVGGDLVNVQSLARGTEDIHQVVMRPSFVSKLNRADAVVYLGLTVEHSFLPGLLDVARNPKMRMDTVKECIGSGCIDCSSGIHVLEKPENLSRAEGELHPQGNPHYNVSPDNGPQIARNIAEGLSRVDPDHAAQYEENLTSYLAELEPKIKKWHELVAPLKGLKAISYHKDVAYLGRFTGLDFVDTVELKPGIAPTPTHLTRLVQKMKDQGVKIIVREQHFEPKTCEWLAQQTGAKIAVVGVMANAFPGTETFEKIMEHNIEALVKASGQGS